MLKITLASILVDDQDKAEKFYTGILDFKKKQDFPAGGARWLTVTSKEGPQDIELALEPAGYPFARDYQKALFEADIPIFAFACSHVQAEYERLLKLGVKFRSKPVKSGDFPVMATFEDTCGNLIQIFEAG